MGLLGCRGASELRTPNQDPALNRTSARASSHPQPSTALWADPLSGQRRRRVGQLPREGARGGGGGRAALHEGGLAILAGTGMRPAVPAAALCPCGPGTFQIMLHFVSWAGVWVGGCETHLSVEGLELIKAGYTLGSHSWEETSWVSSLVPVMTPGRLGPLRACPALGAPFTASGQPVQLRGRLTWNRTSHPQAQESPSFFA